MGYLHICRVFKALGDETRLRILSLLSYEELCVCQIGETLNLSQPSASKHLNKLRNSGIIKCTKISQWCFYSIQDSFKNDYPCFFEFLLTIWNKEQFAQDFLKLEAVISSNLCCQQVLQKNKNHENGKPKSPV